MTHVNAPWRRLLGSATTVVAASTLAIGVAPLAGAQATGPVLRAAQVSSTGGWAGAAQNLRAHVGSRYAYVCPAGGPARSAWGVDVYSDDSSVCTAAVHAGRISVAGGGTVTIEIRPGQSAYAGSTRNGITTNSYGAWGGSFVFVTGGATTTPPAQTGWAAVATQLRGKLGKRFVYTCPAGGKAGRLWGTGVYSDDSSVCTAAVHAGRITLARGGTVTIEIRAGQRSYAASTRNGIAAKSWGSYPGSFVLVGATAGPASSTAPVTTPPLTTPRAPTTTAPAASGPEEGGTGWGAAAQNLRSRVGAHFAYTCPAGGPARTAWGTDVYTDDSSVCTAAVHAGRITVAGGGRVVIEIMPGQSAYTGSARNGITTDNYATWGGSYRFVD